MEEHEVGKCAAAASVRLSLPRRIDRRKDRLRAVAVLQKRSQTCAEGHMSNEQSAAHLSARVSSSRPLMGLVEWHVIVQTLLNCCSCQEARCVSEELHVKTVDIVFRPD